MSDTLTITEACAGRLRELLGGPQDRPTAGLRIEVVQGGCSGYQYRLALDECGPRDVVTEAHGVRAFTSTENLPFVAGSSIDYRPDGFHVDNPNIVYGCGCGNSFVLREDHDGAAA